MATHRMSIMGGVTPGSSGNVYLEPYSIKASNDVWQHLVLVFIDTATRDLAYGLFDVPQNYVGTAKFYVIWTSTATSGNVVWDLDYRAISGDDAESLDQATVQEALTVTDAAPSAAHERNTPSMTATASNIAAGDTVTFLLARDGASSDTMAAAAIVHDIIFEFADA